MKNGQVLEGINAKQTYRECVVGVQSAAELLNQTMFIIPKNNPQIS